MMNARPDTIFLGEAMAEFARVEAQAGSPLYKQSYGGDISNATIAAARILFESGISLAIFSTARDAVNAGLALLKHTPFDQTGESSDAAE